MNYGDLLIRIGPRLHSLILKLSINSHTNGLCNYDDLLDIGINFHDSKFISYLLELEDQKNESSKL